MSTIDIRGAVVSAADPPIGTNPNPDLAWKAPVRVATTGANIALAGLQTIDGVALVAGDRVLVKDQADQTTNGLYNAATGNWTRTIDAANNSQWTQGVSVLATQGTANANAAFRLAAANPVVVGTSALTFTASVPVAAVSGDATVTLAGVLTLAAAPPSDVYRERLKAGRTYFIRTPPTNVTLTIASPGVVTWNNHGLAANAAVVFNTTGSLPTGLLVGVFYYVVGSSITANTFQVSAAPHGSAINFTGAQSGTQSAQTGSDSNSGLNSTASGALLTVQRYVSIVNQSIELNGNSVVGQLADGYYLENVNLLPYIGRGSQGHTTPTIQGNPANHGAVVIQSQNTSPAVSATETGGFEWVLKNVNISAPSATGVDVDVGSWVAFDGVLFSACVNHVICSGGIAEFVSPCTWAASAASCGIQLSNQGRVLDTGNAHVISNNPSWGFAFLFLQDGCQGYFPPPCSFTGASTGTRWKIDASSYVDAGGVSFDTLFPGSVNGSYTPIEVRRGGTAANVASGTALDNITGFASTGFLRRTGAGTYAFDAPGQMLATATNDNAAGGDVGEFVTSTTAIGSAVGLTSGTPANVTSISLTAGDWDVWAVPAFTGPTNTTVNYLIGCISTTSASLTGGPPSQQNVPCFGQVTFNQSNTYSFTVGQHRISLAGTTTVFLVAQSSFATSTCSGFGTLSARRRR
jgi:hypothetical protein